MWWLHFTPLADKISELGLFDHGRKLGMMPTEGVFLRSKGGLPFAARVTIAAEAPSAAPGITFHCVGSGWTSQGNIEEVPAVGYDDWKVGAAAGVRHALRVAGAATARVEVHQILGMATDTNLTIVGAAAALATWRALGFEPPAEVLRALEAVTFASWDHPDQVPTFAEQDTAFECGDE